MKEKKKQFWSCKPHHVTYMRKPKCDDMVNKCELLEKGENKVHQMSKTTVSWETLKQEIKIGHFSVFFSLENCATITEKLICQQKLRILVLCQLFR